MAALPVELTSKDRWVRWARVRRGDRWTKLPLSIDGSPASTIDAATWGSYASVRGASAGSGIGFVLGEGIGCVDLDHCIIDGCLTVEAAAILEALPVTFTEVSPSGDGLHIWLATPEARGRRFRIGSQNVEVYSAARYMTVTGKPWGSSLPVLAACDNVVETVAA